MAVVDHLHLTHCRHFNDFSWAPSKGLNIITGPNASGKTSILEAIYLLAHAKSFRTATLDKVIMQGESVLTLFTHVYEENGSDESVTLGFQRQLNKSNRYHLNKEPVKSVKYLTDYLPIQLITTESTRFFTDGPKLRRDFLSWGLFYTESQFYKVWKQYQRALAQRNRALKQGLGATDLVIWDRVLIESAEQIDNLNTAYLAVFKEQFYKIIQKFLPELTFELRYYRGWSHEVLLEEALADALEKSYALGYTTVGSHRSDLQLYINDKEAQDVLSRGQLKLASYALALAQGIVLKQRVNKVPIYLIDDLAAELDKNRQQLVFDLLFELQAQIFVTNIEEVTFNQPFDQPLVLSLT